MLEKRKKKKQEKWWAVDRQSIEKLIAWEFIAKNKEEAYKKIKKKLRLYRLP